MQAIQESNASILKALNSWEKVEHPSEEEEAFLEVRIASVKATQGLAYAVLCLAKAMGGWAEDGKDEG